jgi:hypothetical protein
MPMIEPPISWERTQNRISDVLGVPVASLDPRWAGLASEGTRQAWLWVYNRAMALGYGAANIQASYQILHTSLLQAVIIALEMGSVFSTYNDEQLKRLDAIRSELKDDKTFIALSIGGQPIGVSANESPVGGINHGRAKHARRDSEEFDRMSGVWPRRGWRRW